MYAKLFLNAKEEKEIQQGFPWVFDNEISHLKHRADDSDPTSEWKNEPLGEASVADGSAVEVFTKAGGFLGTGILNKKSRIAVRLIGSEHGDVIFSDTKKFWEKRIERAYNYRQLYYSPYDSYRLVFGEADLIPGFICERFCTEDGSVYLVVQFLALACEVFRDDILNALKRVCRPDGIYERSDEAVREKEGLPLVSGWIFGKKAATDLVILENGVRLCVDIKDGQKTGYFLDQKFNREQIKRFCHGKRILDTFSHTGAFALNAFKAGAREVISVDISETAVEMVGRNVRLNGAENVVNVLCADTFDLLKKYEADGEKFDVIILDPPAFTKSAKSIQKAYGGYKEINLRAMRLLNEGGILVTCSCSHFFDSATFYDMLMHAATDSHKRVQILEKRGAGPDHPILAGYPKSEYLKCAICIVR